MQAKLKMRLQYDQPYSRSSESPFIHVLPNEPTQAYKRLDHSRLQAIKKTQKIPFSLIRELILAYILPNQQVMDTQQSELLKQKLSLQTKYQNEHNAVNKIYDELYKQKVRLNKLYQATHKYIECRQKSVSSQLQRTIHRRYDSSELSSLMRSIEDKKQNELRALQRKADESSRSMVKVDTTKQKMQIEQAYNRQILKLFEEQLPKLQKLSQEFHQMFENSNECKLFVQEFEKALVFIMSARKISNRPNKRADERLLKASFYVQLKSSIHNLTQFLQQSLENLFEWRLQVKYGKANLQESQTRQQYNQWTEDICKNVYNLLPDIISILKSDKENIKKVQSQIGQQYSNFLPSYYDAKQVALFYKKESKIEEILENEKERLIAHLKKNYGMMVHYVKSENYLSSIEEYKSKSKGYLRDILNKKIGLLQTAINFVNKQYGQLYKQACDSRPGIRDKITGKCRSLEGSLGQNQMILSLLLQSCRRLLNIINT